MVVLEPAGSVLVIRQTSLGGNVATSNTNSNAGSNNAHETHGLANHAAVSTIASNDHNQNRIVVVRSSSSTCMTTTVSRLIRRGLVSLRDHADRISSFPNRPDQTPSHRQREF